MKDVWKDVWLSDEPHGLVRHVVGPLRLAYMVVHGFFKDQCHLRATALAYVTILSVAPLLAVAFSISKALGLHNAEFTRDLLLTLTAGRSEIVGNIVSYIENTGVGTLGVLGVLALFVAALSMLNTVEHAFNKIWGVERGRSPWRKLTDYLTVVLISPVLVFAALSFNVSLHGLELLPLVSQITALALKVAPYIMVWLAFFLLYVFVPNTKVPLSSAAWSAVLAGTLWQLAQMFYVRNQADIATHSNVIYGSFAQFPLFLIWLYISWVIVLLGGEVGYALAHQKSYLAEMRARKAGVLETHKLAVVCMLLLTKRFAQGQGGYPEPDLAARLGESGRTVLPLMQSLGEAGLTLRAERDGQTLFALAKAPESIRVMQILQAVSDDGAPASYANPERYVVDTVLEELRLSANQSQANLTLRELYERACGQSPDVECLEE